MLHVSRIFRTAPLLAAAAFSLHAARASAQEETGLAACGNIDVSAQAECEVIAEGGCVAQCEPVRFEAACEGQCEGQCTASADVDCKGTCEGSCQGECEIDPGAFDCAAECKGSCEGDCQAACGGTDGGAECQASCKGRCEGECDAECEVVPPEADCQAKCGARCEGTCTAAANAQCEGQCTGDCKAELEGGCEAQCQAPEGALFCDGQYVDSGDNLAECVAALEAALDIEIEGSATGQSSCEGNACAAEGQASCSCTTVPVTSGSFAPIALGLGLVALLGNRRRSRRSRGA
jgi:hypothetical protein